MPKSFFSLPEFPASEQDYLDKYPDGAGLRAYIQAYAEHFDLLRVCVFGARVSETAHIQKHEAWSTCYWHLVL